MKFEPKVGDTVRLGDGRTSKVEQVSKLTGTVWSRDSAGKLTSAHGTTGWASTGNGKDDIKSVDK